MNQKKVAIISGAATGIGRASAVGLVEDFDLVLLDWNKEEGEKTEAMCREAGGTADFVYTDMGNEEEVIAAVKYTMDRYGKIDFFFCNHGWLMDPQDFADTEKATLDKVLHCNVYGTFFGLKYVLKEMMKQNAGNILVTASSSGIRPECSFGVYSASKCAVLGMVKDTALEYSSRYNIRINAIAPGGIVTPMTAGVGKYMQEHPEYTNPWPSRIPMGDGALGFTQDVVPMVKLMASDASRYMTGAVISIDGGITQ